MSTPEPCNQDIYDNGEHIDYYDTWSCGGAAKFDLLIKQASQESGQPIDWHYAAGYAQVLTTGDVEKAREAVTTILEPIQKKYYDTIEEAYFK